MLDHSSTNGDGGHDPPSQVEQSRRRWCWLGSFVFLLTLPILTWLFQRLGVKGFGTTSAILLVTALLTSTYTDLRWRLIPNWITFPLIIAGLSVSAIGEFTSREFTENTLGAVRIQNSVAGLVILFVGLLVITALSGGGAGDVKLVGGIGTVLGVVKGAEAVCVSFLICAIVVIAWALLRMTPVKVFGAYFQRAIHYMFDWGKAPDESQRKLLKLQIPQAPFFTFGTLVIMIRDMINPESVPFEYLNF